MGERVVGIESDCRAGLFHRLLEATLIAQLTSDVGSNGGRTRIQTPRRLELLHGALGVTIEAPLLSEAEVVVGTRPVRKRELVLRRRPRGADRQSEH